MNALSGFPRVWLWLHARGCALALEFRWKLWHGESVIPDPGEIEPVRVSVPDGLVSSAFAASRRAARYLSSLDTCLARSIVLFRLLAPFGGARLHIGVRSVTGGIAGHAWVSFRGVVVGESPEAVAPFAELPFMEAVPWDAEFEEPAAG